MKNKPTIVVQKRQDATEYLMGNEANAKRLLESIAQIKTCSYGVAAGQIYLAADGALSGHVVVDATTFADVNDVIVRPFDRTKFYAERRIDAFKLAKVRYYLTDAPSWMPK